MTNGDVKADNQGTVFKVSVKYAPFNKDDPELWFAQLETQFQLSGVTLDGTKYGHLIAALDSETLKQIRERILDPPATEKYISTKNLIIERVSDSAKLKLDRLLSGLQLGDRKPSQLLREMQALAANQLNDNILQNLWLTRLPQHTQEILACMENLTIDKLAAAADKILEVKTPSIYSTNIPSNHSSHDLKDVKASINALEKKFDKMMSNSKNSQRSRDPSRSRSNQQTKKRNNCWYHFRFGSKAKKCTSPCKFNDNNSSGSGN